MEYLLIITVVAIIVLACFRGGGLLPNVYRSQSPDTYTGGGSDSFFSKVTRVVQGENPSPINGGWCKDASGHPLTCECPSPAFGGSPC